MNLVVLVGKVADRPFRPGGRERVVVKLDVVSERRSGRGDRIEVHCFGDVGAEAVATLNVGDIVTVRGRLEQRIGRDEHGEYEDLRVVADHLSSLRFGGSRDERRDGRDDRRDDRREDRRDDRPEDRCDGSSCTDETFVDGVIKFFRSPENYGFITTPNVEGDAFFHTRDVHFNVAPQRDDTVRFVLTTGDRGLVARHISITSPDAAERSSDHSSPQIED
jgi:cold shock CspA family protein